MYVRTERIIVCLELLRIIVYLLVFECWYVESKALRAGNR